MIHAYMAAVFPEEKPAFFSMITGNVNELYAFHHHFKWWKEIRGGRSRLGLEGEDEPGVAPPGAQNREENRAPSEAEE
jgi:cytochrome b subunit of formate dehydrogenase